MFTVVWWIFGVMAPAYTTIMMFVGYIVFRLAKLEVVFKLWTFPLMWLMIGAFLIAAAVTKSGLAKRVAYYFMTRYANSYTSMVTLVYVLGFVLSFLIPHPFPRTLLIMAIVAAVIVSSKMGPEDAAALGFAVGLALPVIGDMLAPPDFNTGVNWSILIFVGGALAIGTVGKETGMAQRIAKVLLPATPPANPYGGICDGCRLERARPGAAARKR